MLNRYKEWLIPALILVVTFIVFSPAIRNDFVNWDDDLNVTENPNVLNLSAEGVKNMFSERITQGYTPLTTLSFALENEVFGLKPGVFHFNNILLHLLCTLLVYILFTRLGANRFITIAVTLLFGIHPMRVESVAWISERKDVLYGFFFLLSLVFYVYYHKHTKKRFYFLALVTFILSLLSKVQAVSLPLALILIDFYIEKRFRWKQLLNKIPFFVLSLITGLAHLYLIQRSGSLEASTDYPFYQRIFLGAYSFFVYLFKAFVPYRMSAIYPYPEKLSAIFYAAGILLVPLVFLVYKSGKARKELAFGLLLFLANVVFVLQILGVGQAYLADRFTYLAYIGLFFLMAWSVSLLFTGKMKPVVVIAGAGYLAFLGMVTWNRTQVWRNSETLFTDVVKKYPNESIAHNNLGFYYRDLNLNEKAIESYTRSIKAKPLGYLAYSNRGEVYFDLGNIDKALSDINFAIKLNPRYSKAYSNRGAIRGSRKEFDLALADLDTALTLDNKNLKAYSNRLLVFYSTGNYEKAIGDANSILQVNPGDADILNQRGLCYSKLNKSQEALTDFNSAILLNPGKGKYFQNRSYELAKTGDLKGALSDILKARELGIKVNNAYVNALEERVSPLNREP